MNLKPVGERVIVKQESTEKTAGGIYIPESANKERKEGIIVAVGADKDGKPLPLKAGQKILYGGYSNDEIEVDGQSYVIVDFKDVLATIN